MPAPTALTVAVLNRFNIRIHLAGWPFIFIFFVVTVVAGLLWTPAYAIGGILTAWCTYFFRDPERVTSTRPGLIVSPADGRISQIAPAVPPGELEMPDEPLERISIFMNVFNVHVNRIPVDGEVAMLGYRPGKFLNASFDKASEENERQAIRITTPDGHDIAVVQIAGLIARRILCALDRGQRVRAGERFGMIRFGSRLDVYLPKGVAPLVAVGQTAVAGETVLADFGSDGIARGGETR